FKAAAEVGERLLEIDARDTEALRELAGALEGTGRADAALEALDLASRVDPMDRRIGNGKGALLRRLGRSEAALTVNDQFLDPNHYDAYRTKGVCLLRSGHAEDALPCFDFVLKVSPKDARVLTWKGEANEALGRNAEAFAAFDAAIESDPEFGEAWRSKGLLHVKVEQFPAAADALAHATVARPADKALWYMRGFSEERAGEFDAAVQSYDEALRLDARDKVTWNSKGLALV